jgi:translation initiation factor IF-1
MTDVTKAIDFLGVVQKAMGNGNFLVKTSELPTPVRCTLSGKIKKNTIKIIEGDKVRIEASPYDLTRGRIVYRMKE